MGKIQGMSINHYIIVAKKNAIQFSNNPNVYIAALICGLVGLGVGGAVGAFSGGFIGYSLKLLGNCITLPWGLDPSMSLGVILGLGIGAGIGAVIIGLFTTYNIYINTRSHTSFSKETTHKILLSSLGFSIELATGMALGAIIGSLKEPGYGSIVGALIGLIIMILAFIFKR